MNKQAVLDVETLKSSIPIESVIGEVVELKNGKGLCPFHEDRNPSLSVKNNRFRCFSCGASGDVVDFTQKYHGMNFMEAVKHLAARAGIQLNKERPASAAIDEARKRRELLGAFRQWEREFSNLLAEALRLYRRKEAAGFTYREAVALADVIQDFPYIEYCYDILCGKDDAEKFELFKQEYGI